jgi:YggT family protein
MNIFVHVLYFAVMIYGWLIVARALLSWFAIRHGTVVWRVQEVIFALTEPYLAFFRRLLPPGRFGSVGIDWSFLAGLLVVFVVIQVLVRL